MARTGMGNVISCSRRSDIPAFHYGWLQDRLTDGYADLWNRHSGQPYRVDLDIGATHSIVLWSKDFGSVLRDPGMLDAYNLYFQFTITGYGETLEPGVQSAKSALRQMEALCERYSPRQVMWRYDPLLFVREGDSVQERLDTFSSLSASVAGMGIPSCTTSLATLSQDASAGLSRAGIDTFDLGDGTLARIAGDMVGIAGINGISLRSCSTELLVSSGIERARCIDGPLLESIFGGKVSHAKDPGQRDGCGCTKSRDIGSYSAACGHACRYCYASHGNGG